MCDEKLAVQAVLTDVAERFSLPANLCTAWDWERETLLSADQVLSQVWCVELLWLVVLSSDESMCSYCCLHDQVAGHRIELTLEIDFPPSLAFYIWHSFKKGLCHVMDEWEVDHWHMGGHMVTVWLTAAEVCSTEGCIAASMDSSLAFLPAVLAVDPTLTFPVDSLLYQKRAGLTAPAPSILPEVEPVARNLLLFAQFLAVVAAERESILANVNVRAIANVNVGAIANVNVGALSMANSTQEMDRMRSAIASKLEQLTDISRCTPVQLIDLPCQYQTADPQFMPQPSQLVCLLRSAVLITKLATLTFKVKGIPGPVDMEASTPMLTLWQAMSTAAMCIWKMVRESVGTSSTNQGEAALSSALFEHSVVALRQLQKEPEAEQQKLACLQMMLGTLGAMQPELVGQEAKRLGRKPN